MKPHPCQVINVKFPIHLAVMACGNLWGVIKYIRLFARPHRGARLDECGSLIQCANTTSPRSGIRDFAPSPFNSTGRKSRPKVLKPIACTMDLEHLKKVTCHDRDNESFNSRNALHFDKKNRRFCHHSTRALHINMPLPTLGKA